jgi:hypothetical protein
VGFARTGLAAVVAAGFTVVGVVDVVGVARPAPDPLVDIPGFVVVGVAFAVEACLVAAVAVPKPMPVSATVAAPAMSIFFACMSSLSEERERPRTRPVEAARQS